MINVEMRIEFKITSRLNLWCWPSQMVLSWAIHCALLALSGVVPKSQRNEFPNSSSNIIFYSAVVLQHNISLLEMEPDPFAFVPLCSMMFYDVLCLKSNLGFLLSERNSEVSLEVM